MLDDLRKNIQQNQRWALKDWVEGAKLLVIAADVHGLKGDDYVQFACAHMPIEGKTRRPRNARPMTSTSWAMPRKGSPPTAIWSFRNARRKPSSARTTLSGRIGAR